MTKHKAADDFGRTFIDLNFSLGATQSFDFLGEFGFERVEALPSIVRYRYGDIEVDICIGRKSYELDFEISRGGEKYSIQELIRITDPNAARQYRSYAATTQDGLKEGFNKLRDIVKKYGRNALRGDPEVFILLEQQRKSWSREYALDVLEGQLRPKAELAFRQKKYSEAVELYEKIRSRLTLAELKKLEIAKARSRS